MLEQRLDEGKLAKTSHIAKHDHAHGKRQQHAKRKARARERERKSCDILLSFFFKRITSILLANPQPSIPLFPNALNDPCTLCSCMLLLSLYIL